MASRRSVLLALGGLAVGGGALLGTGAFTTVEAERSVALETADDSDAFLGFEILDEHAVDETDGTIAFDLLVEATTRFERLVDVRNNGTQTVRSLRFEFDVTGADQPDAAVEDALRVVSGDATIDAIDDANLLLVSNTGGAADDLLDPGEAVPFGIEVDLTGDIHEISGDPEITLTVIADTEGGGGGGGDGTMNRINSVSLGGGTGNDIKVTVQVDTDDSGAELYIRSVRTDGSLRNETTVNATSGTYTVLGKNQVNGAKPVSQVKVTLRSVSGEELQTVTRTWPPS
jgi:hypothetical protein